MSIEQELMNRANSQCELCTSTNDLSTYEVPYGDKTANQAVLVCNTCKEQLSDDKKIDESHWHCLNDAMWSEQDAVKIVSYQMLHKLNKQDLIEMMYFEDDVKILADKGLPEEIDEDALIYRDSNGVILNVGDSIVINKDLPVKGAGFTAKQGTAVRNISLVPNDPTHVEGRVNGVKIHIKCEFIKKMQSNYELTKILEITIQNQYLLINPNKKDFIDFIAKSLEKYTKPNDEFLLCTLSFCNVFNKI